MFITLLKEKNYLELGGELRGLRSEFFDLRLRVIDDVGGGTPVGSLDGWTLHFKSDVPWECNPVGCGEAVPPAVGDTLMVDRSGGCGLCQHDPGRGRRHRQLRRGPGDSADPGLG